jgi:hypothetical protein
MALKFEADEAVTVGFPTGTFEKVAGNFGPQYLYTVEVNGLQDKLYASEKLHKVLQETGVKSGSRFVIVKEDKGNRTVWKIAPAGDRPSSPTDAAQKSKQADTKGSETGAPAASGAEVLAGGLFGLAARCLRESLKAWRWLGENFTSDNVQATANTLFIACSDRGIVLPPIPYPDQEQMEALARIGDAIVPEQRAKLEKKVEEGITWVEAQAIIDYYQEKHGQAKKAA